MQYKELLQETWKRHILFSVMLELTYHCNLDCFFCYNDRRSEGRAMALGDYLHLLEDAEAMGVMNLTLTGGEPTVSPHFFPIGNAARERGFVIRVKTNGHALNPPMARRIKEELDPFNLDISLHGATAESHDRQTRIPGSFDRLLRNLETAATLGLRIQLNSVLTTWNEHEIEEMYRLADERSLRLQLTPQVSTRDDGDTAPLDIAPSPEGIERLFRIQRSRGALSMPEAGEAECDGETLRATQHCGAGASSVTVDPWGNVLPCVQWRRPLGNLHDQALQDIWAGSPVLEQVRTTTVEVKGMIESMGPLAGGVGFCPALAEQIEGSPMTFDRDSKVRLTALENMARDDAD